MIDDSKYIIRRATFDDIDFITKVIIEAEKSMTNNFGLANFFEMGEDEIEGYIKQILEEEVDGCEFSLSSFFVAEYEGETVSALGGWLEGYFDEMPSEILKSNLVGFVFPKDKVLKTASKADIVRALQIPREMGTYQLEYSYTRDDHRGHRLIQRMMMAHLAYAKEIKPDIKKAQLHVFENNPTIIKVHERSGFHIAKRFVSDNPKALEYYPYNVELLMERDF